MNKHWNIQKFTKIIKYIIFHRSESQISLYAYIQNIYNNKLIKMEEYIAKTDPDYLIKLQN